MSIIATLNGVQATNGILIAPAAGKTFPVRLGLKTSDGTSVTANLKVVPGGAGVVLANSQLQLTATEQAIDINASSASHAQNDTVLQVEAGGHVLASLHFTSITNVEIVFSGRFQARFATDGDFYNEKRGTSAGWNFALESEPDFVPPDSVAATIDKPVGRVVYFNQPPVPVRSHVAAVGVKVTAIKGTVGTTTHTFTSGDSIIGQPVNLGPHTYLAANAPQNPSDPPPAETYGPGDEPMAIFEFHLGTMMSGKPATPQDRPVANGLFGLTQAEITQYAIIPLATFSANRKQVLLNDYHALSPQDRTGTVAGRNLAKRIAHLGGDAASGINAQTGTLPFGYSGKEIYKGLVNGALQVQSGASVVAKYFQSFAAWVFECKMFNYHSDEQCGRVDGTLGGQALGVPLVHLAPTDSGPRLPR